VYSLILQFAVAPFVVIPVILYVVLYPMFISTKSLRINAPSRYNIQGLVSHGLSMDIFAVPASFSMVHRIVIVFVKSLVEVVHHELSSVPVVLVIVSIFLKKESKEIPKESCHKPAGYHYNESYHMYKKYHCRAV